MATVSEMYEMVLWFGGVNALSTVVIVGFLSIVYWIVHKSGRSTYGQSRAFRVLATNQLSAGNLSHELKTVTETYKLGTSLGIPPYELRKIEQQNSGTDRRRAETVDLWLRRTPSASWTDVVTALKEMEENALAEELCRKYIRRASIKKKPPAEKFRPEYIRRATDSHQEVPIATAFAFENRQAINGKFAVFWTNVCDKILKNGVDIEEFRRFTVAIFPPDYIPPSPTDINKIFEAITHHGLWDTLHYSPLVQIIRKFGAHDPEMEGWKKNYLKDLKSYTLLTSVEDCIEYELLAFAEPPQAQFQKAKYDPRYFCPVEWKTNFTVDHSLQYLTDVWEMFSARYLMPDSPPTALLDHVRKGCVSVTWLVPTNLIPQLVKGVNVDTEFLQRYQILKVTVSGVVVYENEVAGRSTDYDAYIRELQHPLTDVNACNAEQEAPIHTIVKRKCKNRREREEKMDLLLALLTYSRRLDIDTAGMERKTAMHLAVEACDLNSVKALLSFGANVNPKDEETNTPLDLLEATAVETDAGAVAEDSNFKQEIVELLKSVGAKKGRTLRAMSKPPPVLAFPDIHGVGDAAGDIRKSASQDTIEWTARFTAHYYELEKNIEQRLSFVQVQLDPSEAMSIAMQLRELKMYEKAGSRILFLDGGGVRGLVQIEILDQLEQATGRRITELFDWIVGTSTGGVIALALVYAEKTLHELRQLYFRLKDEVFGKARASMAYNTAALEKILKEELGDLSMSDVKYPRVLIPAVKKDFINLKLHFFNNCFDDEFSNQPVWDVARCTSAAPVLFGQHGDFVDGGILANNPCECGLTQIQNFYRERGKKLPISLVVSVGSGKYPKQQLGNIDAQQFLFCGPWFDLRVGSTGVRERTRNLLTVLTNALVETETATDNCRSRCIEQGITFFRLNPRLEEVIEAGETNSKKLLNMIVQTRKEMNELNEFGDLVLCFHKLSDVSRKVYT